MDRVLVQKEHYLALRQIALRVALTVKCPDCGADIGAECRPEFGCGGRYPGYIDRAEYALDAWKTLGATVVA